ncbi:MAG TPA: hypothetical protein VN837_05450 [Chloroflexota bacterium]|nr:hypothetical protein [Chloroflexota bacterium]
MNSIVHASYQAAAELSDPDDLPPRTWAQEVANYLLPLEKMAVVSQIAGVVGHDLGPAEWDWIGRGSDPCLSAVCRRCPHGQGSVYWDGHEWLMDLTECLMPCHGGCDS